MTISKPEAAKNATTIEEIEALAGLHKNQIASFWRGFARFGAEAFEKGIAELYARIENRHKTA